MKDILELIGFALVLVGVALVHIALAGVVAGLLLVWFANYADYKPRLRRATREPSPLERAIHNKGEGSLR